MKEKCIFATDLADCERCLQVRKRCVSNRVVGKRGRRPRTTRIQFAPPQSCRPITPSTPSNRSSSESDTSGDGDQRGSCGDTAVALPLHTDSALLSSLELVSSSQALLPFEESLLDQLRTPRRWNFIKYLSIGPTFEHATQEEIRTTFDEIYNGNMDGLLACFGALCHATRTFEGIDTEANIRRGTLAVKKLRSTPVPTLDQLSSWLVYGMCIVTFALSALGSDASTVRRHCLGHVASLEGLPDKVSSSASLTYLATLEIQECLLKRQVPIYRPRRMPIGHLDRLMGAIGTLLPHLYDICELSHALDHADSTDKEDIRMALDTLELKIEMWQPSFPQNFSSGFTSMEVVHIMTQGEVWRCGALLFIHRLTKAFDTDDKLAAKLSRRVLGELQRARNVTQEPVRNVTFPFFLACLEARGEEEKSEIIGSVTDYVDPSTPLVQDQVRRFLKALWQVRDHSHGFLWLSLMKHLPSVTLSI